MHMHMHTHTVDHAETTATTGNSNIPTTAWRHTAMSSISGGGDSISTTASRRTRHTRDGPRRTTTLNDAIHSLHSLLNDVHSTTVQIKHTND